jgi:hypothetical protein
MPVQPDQKYPATLVDISSTESKEGTFGLFVTFQTDDGNVSRTLWVTSAALAKTREALEILGATDAELADWEWLQDPKSLCGRSQCQITTEAKVNKDTGLSHVEVLWINSLRRKGSAAKAQAAALMMQRTPEPSGYVERSRPRTVPKQITDDDVPF